jgi:hypothetical protein
MKKGAERDLVKKLAKSTGVPHPSQTPPAEESSGQTAPMAFDEDESG